ncbi:GGDEF domain-containing protein [Bosea sp. AS-1]|uniref:GGDEF domain-containing protein n=1 Tax=Bosea sp. AS-1 TaxID=2015316 RepID=UPI000B78C745|nr:GGDEF domain-containing protein [Bosea sp. AS-1]
MSGIILLLAQALIYFGVMAFLFRLRHVMGLGAFLCALGVMHFLETYLAAVFFIQLPFGLLSPGSTVLFSGKLAIILLFYIREDAETVRQPIYGLLVGNFLMVALVMTLRLYGSPVALPGYNPDLVLIDQMGALMVWGTTLLFVDSIALILLYEKLHRLLPHATILRACLSLAVILTFDQLCFFIGLHAISGTPWDALFGGWIAKMGAAIVYSALMGLYLQLFERDPQEVAPQPLADVFYKLTYRRKYEELLGKSGHDALTGALTRERFDTSGPAVLARAASLRKPLSLAMLDVDHFKSINDRYGHITGDEVLRRVAECLRAEIRSEDKIFRYGGEEFVILSENMPHAAALAYAERMRTAVRGTLAREFAAAPTVSIGVATFPDDAANIRDLLAHADVHLYEAKRLGRDRVVGNPEDLRKAVIG